MKLKALAFNKEWENESSEDAEANILGWFLQCIWHKQEEVVTYQQRRVYFIFFMV